MKPGLPWSSPGVVEESTEKYRVLANIAKKMKKDLHFVLEEKNKNIILTEEGLAFAEKALHIDHLYDIEHMDKAHMLVQSLKAAICLEEMLII